LSKAITAIAIDLLGASQLEAHDPNYCNDTEAQAAAGLSRSGLGQFVGYDCSVEFFHCRWQSDGYYTYMKQCKPGENKAHFCESNANCQCVLLSFRIGV
jgi:hypothetical protein